MNNQNNMPFGATFASESAVVARTDPQYSGETQVSENATDLATDTYMKWTEDSDR